MPVGAAASSVNEWRMRTGASITETAAHFGLSAKTVKTYWAKEITPERQAASKAKQIKHGRYGTPEYKAWDRMLRRCKETAPEEKKKYYFDRGIRVCDWWKRFENFFADMGEMPSPAHTVERIDTDGNYEPTNCCWATMKEQQRNKRSNRYLTAFGETKLIIDWANDDRCSVSLTTLRRRVLGLWTDAEAAITTPSQRGR